MERREVYTTQQPDGTFVTTTTRTRTKYDEDLTYGCGRGQLNRQYCMGPHGILRILEIVSRNSSDED
uniref:Uncharacterized protein n=1 Tax=Heterorhabditis bacteriophora TaxID=37862 RepID=A0A1I7XNU3_HETBA